MLIIGGIVSVSAPAGATAPSPFQILLNQTGTAYGNGTWTLMVGDSLTNGVGAQAFANLLKSSNGRSAFVAASSGSSIPNWRNPGWLDNPAYGGGNLASLQNYEDFFKPRITILALGSNDARIMTGSPASYSATAQFLNMVDAVNQAKSRSKCVLLTTVANHWSAATTANVNAVNASIAWADVNITGVYVADWKGYSAGHSDWFKSPTDIHHSNIGVLKYAEYIANVTKLLVASGQC